MVNHLYKLKGSKFALVKSELQNIKINCGSIEVGFLGTPPPFTKEQGLKCYLHINLLKCLCSSLFQRVYLK